MPEAGETTYAEPSFQPEAAVTAEIVPEEPPAEPVRLMCVDWHYA
jgi:hypothetical protein